MTNCSRRGKHRKRLCCVCGFERKSEIDGMSAKRLLNDEMVNFNLNNYDKATNPQDHRVRANCRVDGIGNSHRAELLQRGTNRHQPFGVLPTRRHQHYDSDQND